MSNQSNIIRSLLKVIGFMAFILLITNAVFSNNRIRKARRRYSCGTANGYLRHKDTNNSPRRAW